MTLLKIYSSIFILSLLFVGACGGSSTPIVDPPPEPEPNAYEVRATNSMVKILPIFDLTEFDSTYLVEACRGENEPFQVFPVLLDGTEDLLDVFAYASDLVMGEHIILKSNISLYKEHYVHITEPSDAGGDVGFWPDALAPLTTPFTVVENFPSPLWVDIFIPDDAVPGIYTGTIEFETSDAGNHTFEYSLEVWDILMPQRLYLKANFGLDQEDIEWAHGLDENGLGTPEGIAISKIYAHHLAKRYISVHGIPIIKPDYILRPDEKSFYIDFTRMEADIVEFIDTYDLACFYFPLTRFDLYPKGFIGYNDALFDPDFNARFLDYINQVSEYLNNRGYLDRAFVLFVDEPYTVPHYETIIDLANLMRQADLYPDQMVTEQPAPQGASFPDLFDYVDIFTMNIRVFQWATEEDARAGAENNEEWIYSNTSVHPYPSYSIDKQGVQTRLFVWFAYQHGFTGIFYSSANDWSKTNPYEDALTFGHGMGNGCNNMMYPGFLCNQYTGQDNVDGPLGSIRLELTRDGLEDAQLLYMLGQGEPVEEANVLMTSWEEYCHNSDDFLAVRRELARIILDK